jgi:hypothetical protein
MKSRTFTVEAKMLSSLPGVTVSGRPDFCGSFEGTEKCRCTSSVDHTLEAALISSFLLTLAIVGEGPVENKCQ